MKQNESTIVPVSRSNRADDTNSATHTSSILTDAMAFASSFDRLGMASLRLSLVIILLWIGALKFTKYEAEDIVPLVANSPLMSFFYSHPAPAYMSHMNAEGEVNLEHQKWHESNGTYRFSHGLGVGIILIGLMILAHPIWPRIASAGSFLLIFMSLTTLSFLITTPDSWVPSLGGTEHGFPYLSGVGHAIIKDIMMLAAAIVTMADSAKS